MLVRRVHDPKLLQKIREMPCFICGAPPPSDPDHIVTRKLIGDEPRNLWPLCRICHSEKGSIGLRTFVETYKAPIDLEAIYPQLTFDWNL